MGLKEIKAAGEMAALVTEAANSMSTIKNTYAPKYNALLVAIRASLGSSKTLSNLADDEANIFFFGGLGDATAITNLQTILIEWEKNIAQLLSSVDLLPINDI